MDKILKETGTIKNIYTEEIELKESFIDFASRFAEEKGTVCLLSGGDLDCSRYHILAVKPWLTFSGENNNLKIETENSSTTITSNPFDTLRFLLNYYNLKEHNLPEPVSSGFFGYLSYDLKDCIEDIPRTTINDLELPDIYFSAASIIVVHDRPNNTTKLFVTERVFNNENTLDADLSWFRNKLKEKKTYNKSFQGGLDGFKSNFEKPDYLNTIEKIKDYINSGDIYQVNMSQRFVTDFSGDVFELFKSLYEKNPAPFFAYLNCGNHHIVSTSPERFIKQTGNKVETRPIKGTRPRGINKEEDNVLRTELKNSLKDDAELSMIVDLMRNDIGKVCKSNSVHVIEHKRVEAYQNVFHLISIVEGELELNSDSVDLLKATFPGGSITGCPKIRSMEIIDELESNNRHIYTGSIGYISFHQTMDFSIAIRTATVLNNKLIFSVGGGIVYDSNPEDEFDETIHKGQTLLNAFTKSEATIKSTEVAWMNGLIKPVNEISISIDDPGFHYGFGFFETIRVENGKIMFLKEHLRRLKSAWEKFYNNKFPTLSYEAIIKTVIDTNNLEKDIAVVKIITTKGDSIKPPYKNKIIVTAKKYTHRLKSINKPGIDMILYPEPRQSHLANYKSLNYLYYHLAGEYAKNNGADEALIINTDGSLSETNTANILFIKGKTITNPISKNVLPGIMLYQALKLFDKQGFSIENKILKIEDIKNYDHILLTNSLIGAVCVRSFNNESINFKYELCQEINKHFRN